MDFSKDTFNRSHAVHALKFQEATSPHFLCKYVHREDGTVFQFEPTIIPTRADFVPRIMKALPDIVGKERAQESTVELVKDELIERGESVYVLVPGFTSKTLSASRLLVEKLLTVTHDLLSCGDSP